MPDDLPTGATVLPDGRLLCATCRAAKPAADFSWLDRTRNLHLSSCKPCLRRFHARQAAARRRAVPTPRPR